MLMLLRLGMIVAEQVEHPVREQERELDVSRVACCLALAGSHGRAEHDVAEDSFDARASGVAGAQVVHGEGQHVGGAGLVHPLDMQTRHLFLVDEQDGQVGIRREVEPIEQVRRLRLDARVIDPGNARGVVDIDGHGSRPARAAMRRGGA